MEALQTLKYWNVSFNGLSGEVPSNGPFTNFTGESFMFNEALCGAQRLDLPPCHTITNHNSSRRKVLQLVFIVLGVASTTIAITLVILFLRKKKLYYFFSPFAVVLLITKKIKIKSQKIKNTIL